MLECGSVGIYVRDILEGESRKSSDVLVRVQVYVIRMVGSSRV